MSEPYEAFEVEYEGNGKLYALPETRSGQIVMKFGHYAWLTKEQAKAFFDLEDKPVLKLDPIWKWTYTFDGDNYLTTDKPGQWDEGFSANGGIRFIESPLINDLGKPEESLHQIIDGKLVKYVDIPEDGSPILAHSTEARMISAGKLDNGGSLLCYAGQGNKFTSMGRTVPIRVWRRPTEEELK